MLVNDRGMSDLAASGRITAPRTKQVSSLALQLIASSAIFGVVVVFAAKYVVPNYVHYRRAAFTHLARGAANYRAMRGWFLLHMTAGMLALLTDPWQF